MIRDRVRENPFHVLGVAPDAGRVEIELAGQKLLAMLEIGFAGIEQYATPLGPARRGPDEVRRALAELRDPQKRLSWELTARLAPGARLPDAPTGPDAAPPFPDALAAMGWKP